MHIFVIALFLLQSCHPSVGLPFKRNETHSFGPIALTSLAKTCENSFLVETIKTKGDYCNVNETYSQSDLLCFMFYDINVQLCTAFRHSEFNLQENYTAIIKENHNVASLCDHAKTWKLSTIQTHTDYKMLGEVFGDPVHCQKLCGVGDLLSDDANYFCTYFEWGTNVIQSQLQSLPIKDNKKDEHAPGGLAPIVISAAPTTNNAIATGVVNKAELQTKLPVNPDHSSKQETYPLKSGQNVPEVAKVTSEVVEKTSASSNSPKTEQSSPPVVSSVKLEEDKLSPVEEMPPTKNEVENNESLLKEANKPVKEKLEESNPEDDENEDYQADELGEVQKPDNRVESDPDVSLKDKENPKIGIESITFNNGHTAQRVPELFPNTIQEFTDDDDHFFPIFLTGIVIVVLLYVLYHNKTKFTKVILGLIVEGRQSGRRRNSRGHAYRRLDTLEQAMSSNTSAPPSKIIY